MLRNSLAPPILLASILLTGCGGSSSSGNQVNASPGGIWSGTGSTSGLTLVAFIDESGEVQAALSDSTQYSGTAHMDGNSISMSYDGYPPFGSTFADGSTHGTGTLTGTVKERASISATTQFITDRGAITNDSATLTFNSLYNNPSSLATISGNYQQAATGDVISVSGGGEASWQDPSTGCIGSGTVSVVNPSYNMYSGQFSYSNCQGAAAVLNGVEFSGLTTLDNTTNPERALIAATGAGKFALAFVLNRL